MVVAVFISGRETDPAPEDVDEGKITDDPTTAVAVRVATFATALAVFCLLRCG